jgi:anti-sigma factor (TIGR02949 family)
MTGAADDGLEFNQCREAVRRLTDYLSHELGPNEEAVVEDHLAQCRGCFAKFHFEETLLATIRTCVDQIRPPAALREHVLTLINQEDAGIDTPPS